MDPSPMNTEPALTAGSIDDNISVTPDAKVHEPYLKKFAEFGHICIVGPTGAGKTHRMCNFLCENKFEDYDYFNYIGNTKSLNDLRNSYCASLYKQGKDWKEGKMKYDHLSDMSAVITRSMTDSKSKKLCFFDDAMIQDAKSKKEVAKFLSQAKNSNTNVVVVAHLASGDSELKLMRSACRYFVFVRGDVKNIATIIGITKDNPILKQYEGLNSRSQILIYDTLNKQYFDSNFKAWNSANTD